MTSEPSTALPAEKVEPVTDPLYLGL